MPPNFQRFLPFMLILFVLLFILPSLLHKGSSGVNSKTRSLDTFDAVALIDQGAQAYLAANQRYTSHLGDLLQLRKRLSTDLAVGLNIQLDASTDGKTYVAQVASDVFSLVRARSGGKIVANGCRALKSGSGVSCPKAAENGKLATTTTSTPTTTGK